jgi:uncharacterized repeat protein (TIGR01451 family)
MFNSTWRNWRQQLSRSFRGGRGRRPWLTRGKRARPGLERLEDRTLLSTSIPLNPTTWTDIGPAPINHGQVPPTPVGSGGNPVSGRVTGLATDPTNVNIIYAATAGGGVWKTTNGGTTWAPLTDNLSDPGGNPIPLFMGAVALAPSNPSVVYAGTGEANNVTFGLNSSFDTFYGDGILVSTNGGTTWTLTGQSQFRGGAISRIAVDPQDPNTAYAAVSNNAVNGLSTVVTGIYKTTNGGGTWTDVTAANGQNSTNPWSDVVIDPTTTGNTAVLFAAIGNGFGAAANGVFTSTNGGTTWTAVGGGMPSGATLGRISLAIAHPGGAANATLYASICTASVSGNLRNLERSTDGGTNWTDITANLNGDDYLAFQGGYDNVVEINPTNTNMVFAAGVTKNQGFPNFSGGGIVESQDGGATWTDGINHPDINTGTAGNNGPHTDYHALAFDANGRVVVGNDGGVWRLDSNVLGSTGAPFTGANIAWTDLNGNLEITTLRGIALDPTNPDVAYAGSQDNGTEKFTDNRAWNLSDVGDGGIIRVDPNNTSTLYHTRNTAFFFVSTTGGVPAFTSWTLRNTGLTGNTDFVAPIVIDPNNSNRVLFGNNVLRVTTNQGMAWAALGVAPNGTNAIDFIAIAPSDSKTIYVSSNGSVFVTTNSGTSWTNVTPPITVAPNTNAADPFRAIAVDPANSKIVYVTVDTFTTGGRVFKSTDGGTTWTDITGNLPNFPVASVTLDPALGLVFVGTDVGVYAAFTSTPTVWTRYQSGLPNVRVVEMEVDNTNNILAAATHGRGAFELQPTDADLSVVKTGPLTITAGTTFTYELTVHNAGPSAAQTVTLTDVLPAQLTLVTEGQVSGPDVWTNTSTGNTASFTIATLPAGNTDVFDVVASIPSSAANGTTVTDTATVLSATTLDPNLANNTSSFTSAVVTSADLSVVKAGPLTITAGTTITYTIFALNSGPSDAQSVTLTDALPTGFTLSSLTAVNTNPDKFIPTGSNTVMAATMGAGHTDVFQVVAFADSTLTAGSMTTDTATISSPTTDPNLANNTSTSTATIVTSADLVLVKTGPVTVTAGTTVTYTLTLTNNGPSEALTVNLTDTLPSGLVRVFEIQTGGTDPFTDTSGNNIASWTSPTMAAGSTDVFIVVADAPSSLANNTPLVDTATAASSTFDPTPLDNSSSIQGVAVTAADLSVTKTGPATITAGTTATYTISLTNLGPSDATSVSVSDVLPVGLQLLSEAAISNPDGFTDTSTGNTASFFAATVVAGSSDTFEVVAFGPGSLGNNTRLSDTAGVVSTTFDTNLLNNTSVFGSAVVTVADLSVTKTGPATIAAGQTATYTITLTNLGPSDAANVVLTDAVPGPAVLVSEQHVGGNDTFTDASSGNTARFTGTMVAGRFDVFVVVVSVPSSTTAGTSLLDTASVTSDTTDPNPANNSSSLTTTVAVSADLAVVKKGPLTITAGTSVTYILTVTNNGPSDAQTVSLTDTLPTGLTRVSETQVGGTDNWTDNSTGNLVSLSINTLTAGHSDVFQVVASAASGIPDGTSLMDTAVVSSVTPDPNPLDNTSSVTSTAAAVADLEVVKSGPAQVTAGTRVTYTITLSNDGPSDAQNVAVTDSLPAGLTLVTALATTNPDGFVNNSPPGGTQAVFNATTVVAGHTDVFQVVVDAAASLPAGPLSDTATAASTTTDPDLLNNTSTATGSVVTSADLSVVKEGPLVITAGTMVTYTILATNHGPSDAQGVTLSDTLPAGFALVSLTAVNTNPDKFKPAGALSVTATTMGAGHTDVFQVVAFAASSLPPNTAAKDTATITSATTPDPNTSNNTSASTANIVTAADIAVVKSGPATILAGANITYILTLTNLGPSDAQTVVLTDALPAGVTLLAESHLTGPDAFVNATLGNVPRFTAVTVAAGHSDTFGVVGVVASGVPAGTILTNTAVGSSATFDQNPANNTSVANTTVFTQADLVVAKTGPATATEGDTLTYTLAVANTGPSDAQGVVLVDALPAGETFVGGSVGGVAGTLSGNTVTFALGTLAPGQSRIGTVVVTASEDGPQTDTITATGMTVDANVANNTASVTTVVSEPVLSLNTFSFSTTEFQALNNAAVASFVHANGAEPAGAFNVTINWGDGTNTGGTVVPQGTGYVVQGTHTYVDEGNHTLTVTVTDDGISASAAGTVSVAEGGAPAGTSSVFDGDFIFETIDDIFRQALSLAQVQNLGLALLALDLSAANQLRFQGDGLVQALATAFTMGQLEFPLFATVLHNNGTSLESAVSDMTAGMLAQSLTEPLGLGG